MDQLYVGILGCVSFVVLIFLRVPIAYAMGIVGTAGLLNLSGSYSPKLASFLAVLDTLQLAAG